MDSREGAKHAKKIHGLLALFSCLHVFAPWREKYRRGSSDGAIPLPASRALVS